jgi:hypothetical protein
VELTWIFARNDERLTLRRTDREGFPTLVIDNGEVREYRFDELPALVVFQSDMEQLLVQTGWTLAEFSPNRRSGIDRRGFPRIDNDRRRWWTDARKSRKKAETAAPVQKRPVGSTRSE